MSMFDVLSDSVISCGSPWLVRVRIFSEAIVKFEEYEFAPEVITGMVPVCRSGSLRSFILG